MFFLCARIMDNRVNKSRLEVNFIRLLEETQQIASGNRPRDWTFEKFINDRKLVVLYGSETGTAESVAERIGREGLRLYFKYVAWLEEKVPEMEKNPNPPSEDTVKHYRRQVNFLKGVLSAEQCKESIQSAFKADSIPCGLATNQDVTTQQIHHRAKAKAANKLRVELFHSDGNEDSSSDTKEMDCSRENFQSVLDEDSKKQNKLLDYMLIMAKEWKEQSKIAGNLIKKDIETLESSGNLADANQSRLKVEADRLIEYNKKACNCWIWLMLLLVCFMFIGMVFFIRLFRKKTV